MRQIIAFSILLAVPLAATGAEPQDEQPQSQQAQEQRVGQPQEQQSQTQDQRQQSQQQQQQSGQGSMQDSQGMASQQQTGAEPDVARAQFTSAVQNREPVDEVSEFQAEQAPLYFFTEIKNGAGQTVTHKWVHEGEVMAEVPLEVGSDSWRTWSSKELTPELEGEWTVQVVDGQGNTITEESIEVEASAQTENVGYSPDQQQQQTGQSQDQQQMQDQRQNTEDGDWQSDTLPEEIDYERETQDGMQQTDEEGDDGRSGDDY
ncbi:MAG TPA: DUF2914 domain-containing protein [Gammaproteobacteria bacterium]